MTGRKGDCFPLLEPSVSLSVIAKVEKFIEVYNRGLSGRIYNIAKFSKNIFAIKKGLGKILGKMLRIRKKQV